MIFNKITKYNNCDILIGWNYNNIEINGYTKEKTLGEMIDLALLNECPIIIKNGYNGKWYLKGKNKDIDFLKNKINENIGIHRDGIICYLIE
jgi:hypothetical protein